MRIDHPLRFGAIYPINTVNPLPGATIPLSASTNMDSPFYQGVKEGFTTSICPAASKVVCATFNYQPEGEAMPRDIAVLLTDEDDENDATEYETKPAQKLKEIREQWQTIYKTSPHITCRAEVKEDREKWEVAFQRDDFPEQFFYFSIPIGSPVPLPEDPPMAILGFTEGIKLLQAWQKRINKPVTPSMPGRKSDKPDGLN